MMLVRANMVMFSSTYLGRAATIAVRYCAARRQFRNTPGTTAETQVLDYPQVQMRVLPWLAGVYALRITGKRMIAMHGEMERRFEASGDTLMIPEVHSIGSCLKAVTTTITVDGIEQMRRACGGHGYSSFAGLDTIYGNAMVNFTGEGENFMIVQQASQHLLKVYTAMEAGAQITSPAFGFIRSDTVLKVDLLTAATVTEAASLPTLVAMFEHRAARLLVETAIVAGAHTRPLAGPAQWEGIRAAWAFGELLIVKSFADGIADGEVPLQLRPIMTTLCKLFAVDLVCRSSGEFMMDGYLSPTRFSLVRAARKELLEAVRPCAVVLADALGCDDTELNSAIGGSDGNVYETLLAWAKNDPMNQTPVIEGFHDHYGMLTKLGAAQLEQRTGKKVADIPGIVQDLPQDRPAAPRLQSRL